MSQAKPEKTKDTTDNRARILVVEDHAVVRYGITQLINKSGDLVVCGEEEDARNALDAISRLKPDLVIADISLKESSGLELIRNIKAQYPKLPILVISAHDEAVYGEIAFRAGASGYLMKEAAVDKVLLAIRRVLRGEIYVSDALASKLLQRQLTGRAEAAASPLKTLSDRELEVLQLVGQWKSTRQIAAELHLSVKTVEYYKEQIKKKLNLKGAAALTRFATTWLEKEMAQGGH